MLGTLSVDVCAQTYGETTYANTSFEQSADTLPAPSGFKGTIGATYVNISWDPVEGADSYNIYQYDENIKQYEYIGYTTSPSYKVTNLQKNSSYKFKVCANKGTVSSEKSKAVNVTTSNIETPTIKGNYHNELNSFSWQHIYEIKYYKIYKYNSKTKKFEYIAKTTDDFYTDKKVKNGKKYYYKVSAVGEHGEGNLSEKYEMVIPKLETPTVEAEFYSSCIKVSWNEIPNAKQYYLYKYSTKKQTYALIKKLNASYGTYYTYTDTNIKDGKTYNYKVRAVNDLGKSGYSPRATVKIPAMKLPSAPVIKNTEAYTNSLSFSWNEVKGADCYIIYKYDPNSKKFEEYDTTRGTEVSLLFISPDTTYYFKIAAKNLKGVGPKSKQITITTKKLDTSSHSLTWVCPACGTTNYDIGGFSFCCSYCKNMKPSENTWTCPRCGTTNLNWGLGICSKCKNLKP